MELARLLMEECHSTGDIQKKLKRFFAGTIEQMLEAEMDEHLGYEKNSIAGNIVNEFDIFLMLLLYVPENIQNRIGI